MNPGIYDIERSSALCEALSSLEWLADRLYEAANGVLDLTDLKSADQEGIGVVPEETPS